MKKTKFIRILSASAALVSLLAVSGCQASKGFQGDVDPTTDTRGASIDFWTGFGADIQAYLEPILTDFQNLSGIKVTHTSKGGYDNLQKAINLGSSTVSYPNIAIGYPDHFASYVDSDIQVRMDYFITNDSKIPSTRTGTASDPKASGTFTERPAINMDDFYSYYMTENENIEFDENGKGYVLGLPFNKSTEVMAYNQTFFDNAYIKGLGISVPQTWDDVKTVGPKIRAAVAPAFGKILGADGKVYETETKATDAGTTLLMDLTTVSDANFFPLGYDSLANFFITGLRQWGATYTEVDKTTRKGYIRFGDATNLPITKDFLTYMKGLYDDKSIAIPASFNGTDKNYCSSYYTNFQSVLNIGSSAGLGHYSTGKFTRANGMKTAVTNVPYKDTAKKYVISQGTNLCMLDKGTQAERLASWKAVKYLAQEVNGLFAAETGYYPVCKTATASKEYQDFLTKTKDDNGNDLDDNTINKQAAAKANSNIYDADGSGWTKFVDPGFNGSSTIRNDVGTILSEVFIDGTAIDTVIANHLATLADYVQK